MNEFDAAAAKHVVDGLSFGVLLGTIANLLPHVATLLTIIWMALRIWEMETVRRWTGRKD